MTEVEKTVNALLAKAVKAVRSDDAMRFAQAALNAAHIKHALDQH
jgi:hypothetical protein